jgi:hypothetical protein
MRYLFVTCKKSSKIGRPLKGALMLLRFGATNFLSMDERQEVSFVASKLKDREDGLIVVPTRQGGKVVPVVVLYGANASGKSNMIAALRHIQATVAFSHSAGRRDGGVSRTPFALRPAAAASPTTLDIDFVLEGVRYHFGYECNDSEFVAEWLYAFPEGTRRVLFERDGPESISFGASLTGAKKTLVPFMRRNSLFISTAAQSNHEELGRIASFFQNIDINRSISVEPASLSIMLNEDTIDNRTIAFLNKIGTGVIGHRIRDVECPEDVFKFQKSFMEILNSTFGPPDNEIVDAGNSRKEVELAHRSEGSEEVYFKADRESAGTRRLVLLMNSVFKGLDSGGLVVVDELDASLHTQAAEAIVGLFASGETNPLGAQLLATTHDTNLMHSEFLRRDEIWFAQKDMRGATHVYPLSDIHTRQSDNIERGYLQGRFGAIPFAGSPSGLLSRL